jgi:signal transduction histidine kinase
LEGDDDVFSKFIGHNMAKQFKEKLSELAYIPVVSTVVSSGEIVVVNEFGENETDQLTFFVKNGMQVQHLVCAPLMAGDSAIGILMVFNKKQENDFFRKEDVQLIRSLSSQIARSLETYRLREEKQKAEHLASIGNMMSTIVHDLRTPIGNIQGFVELMQEESDPELRAEFAGIVFEQVKALTSMTKDVLDFAKGKTSILPVKYPVDKIIKQFAATYEKDVVKKGFEFNTDCQTTSMVYVDPEKINRVFMNIMKNALEAMEKGGRFSIVAAEQNGEVVFNLSDNGPGIPEEIKNNLFESFVTSGKEGGTGLGLAIVKKMIEQHKGRIEVESQKNVGTTFKIYLKRL